MKLLRLVIPLVVAAIAVGILLSRQSGESVKPSDMEPVMFIRNAARGKTANDVSKIVFDTVWGEKIVVTKKRDIEGFLDGMRKAELPKRRIGCGGPDMTIVWKDGTQPIKFGFSIDDGVRYAYSQEFAKAWNRVAPADRRIDLSKR